MWHTHVYKRCKITFHEFSCFCKLAANLCKLTLLCGEGFEKGSMLANVKWRETIKAPFSLSPPNSQDNGISSGQLLLVTANAQQFLGAYLNAYICCVNCYIFVPINSVTLLCLKQSFLWNVWKVRFQTLLGPGGFDAECISYVNKCLKNFGDSK